MSFSEIPSNLRVPGQFLEIDPSQAEQGIGQFPLRVLIMGQKTAAGTLAVNSPDRTTSPEDASVKAGPGSIGSRLARAFFSTNRSSEMDLILVDDLGGASPNVVTVTFGGGPASGVLAFYVAGERYLISTVGALTVTAQALADAVNLDLESPFVATINPGQMEQVILTAKNGGEVSNTFDVRVAHLDGESIPEGLTVAIVDTQSGAGNPDITALIAALPDVQYDIVIHPWVDAANLTLLETELASRANALRAIPGHAFTADVGTNGLLAALGDSRNSQFSTIVGLETFPGVPVERGAAIAGLVAFYGSIDPARPFQNLKVPGYAPAIPDRFSLEERNLLLFDGISTVKYDRVGTVFVERLITTYQTNPSGAPSTAFLNVNIALLLIFYRKAYVARMELRFPRHKLTDDGGTPPGPGTSLVTPKVYEAESVAFYQELIALGLFEDLDGFVQNSTYTRDPIDTDRMNIVQAPNPVNAFRVGATLVQFRL